VIKVLDWSDGATKVGCNTDMTNTENKHTMDYSGLSQIVCISQDKSSAWRTQSSSIARTIKDPAFKKDMSQSERSRLIEGENDPQFHTC
jgi:hypothetical protein